MIKKWMTWTNYALAALCIALLLLAAMYYWQRPTDFVAEDFPLRKSPIPKGAFARAAKDYDAIETPALRLDFSPLSVQLPDLRRYLLYYGRNGRPDAREDKPVLYFSFAGNKTPTPLNPAERHYIHYDKKLMPPQYVFSPNNSPTHLWFEVRPQGNQAVVTVGMTGDQGQIVNEPFANAEFLLPEKELVRLAGSTWELGKWRVDGTLLARQKARWYGKDVFMEKHGGEEYKHVQDKQRIDFENDEGVYSVYVGLGDCLIWHEGRWQDVKPGDSTLKYVLMCVKKIDERIMNLELWDVDGKGKVVLNLVKANESWMPQNLEQSFKFVGARTRSQYIFEIDDERVTLSPQDWLLQTEEGWKKLTSAEEIDDYVDRKTVGPLFVFDGIERRDERPVILGTIFNSSRTDSTSVEFSVIPLGNTPPPAAKTPADLKKQKAKENNSKDMLRNPERSGPSSQYDESDDDDDDDME